MDKIAEKNTAQKPEGAKQKLRFLPFLLCLLLVVFAELVCAFFDASSGYGEAAYSLGTLEPEEIAGCEIDGETWQVSGEQSWISYYHEGKIGSARILFSEPLGGNMEFLSYFQRAGENYHSLNVIYGYLMKGTRSACIQLPYGGFVHVRFNLSGYCVLQGIELFRPVPLSEMTPWLVLRKLNFMRLFVFAVFGAGFSLWAVRRRQKADTAGKKMRKADSKAPADHSSVSKTRAVWLDSARVVAAVFVVVVHALAGYIGLFTPGTALRFIGDGTELFLLSCNLLFVMISGALLLPDREESFAAFLKKRLVKVAVPLCICSLLAMRLFCYTEVSPLLFLTDWLHAFFCGEITFNPHMWLLFVLLGLYLIAYPLRLMHRSMTEQTEKILALLIVCLLFLRTLAAYRRETFGIPVFLNDWPGIFMMGYYLTRPWMRRYDGGWLIAGAASLFLSAYFAGTRGNYREIVCNQSVLMLSMSAAVFVLLMRTEPLYRRLSPLLIKFGGLSFTMLMIHWYVLYGIVYRGLLPAGLPMPAEAALLGLLCLLLSGLFALGMNRSILAPFQ